MALSRRFLLQVGAASAVVVVAGGSWLGMRTATSAREPWLAAAKGFGDPRLDALAYAILAPNPHNMQPWRIRLDGGDSFTLFAQLDRLLPETDPPCRQITIGFGCFLELCRQAAAEKGYRAEITGFPEGQPQPTLDERPVAQVRLLRDTSVQPDPLFTAVLERRTQRAPFDTQRPVPDKILEEVAAAAAGSVDVGYASDEAKRATLRKLARDAWTTEWSTAAARRETVDVTRIGKAEVAEKPWGITLDGALFGTLNALGMLSREAMDRPGSTAWEKGWSSYAQACDTAMAFLWSTTAGNSRHDQLRAGAAWVRLQQAATQRGLAFHPLSQALQEFPEMREHYRKAHELLAPAGHTVQMLIRLGYAPEAGPAPRQALESRLIPA